ncbi:MAG: B12-binding domain-containing radical SAM protein [Propionibacteriaceae bacterium]|nr:B12-binding domain-containing radical SAM protein [Propionibacteriaceae bacterium]
MKITFIRPSMTGKQSSDAMKPLVFAILHSLTSKEITTAFYDECVEKLPEDVDGDAVVFSVETLAAKRVYSLAKKYKQGNENLKIIMGGFHPTACPDEALLYADSIVIGDAESVWESLISDLRKDSLKPKYVSENDVMLPFAKTDHSIFRGKKYAKIGVVQWKRGCVYNCNFCSIRAFYKSGRAEREINDVINEIAEAKEKIFFIADDNLLHDRTKLKVFLTELAPLKKKWGCQISINVAKDPEILNLMKKSGCVIAIVGFESLNDETLSGIGKQQRVTEYDNAIRVIHSYGIMLYATFIFGYPSDTLDSFDRVYKFVKKHKLAIVNFNPLLVMPGTALFDELHEQDKLIDNQWWLANTYKYGDATHYPDNITPVQLAEGCKKLRYRFYSLQSILWRSLNPVNIKHLLVFTLINVISYVEIRRKQRLKHGGDGRR